MRIRLHRNVLLTTISAFVCITAIRRVLLVVQSSSERSGSAALARCRAQQSFLMPTHIDRASQFASMPLRQTIERVVRFQTRSMEVESIGEMGVLIWHRTVLPLVTSEAL
jgi:hypothetical protein